MLLLCKQKDKWIAAEEDDLRSFAVNNVMTKNPRLPDNGKALPLKDIYDQEGHQRRYNLIQSSPGSTSFLSDLWRGLH